MRFPRPITWKQSRFLHRKFDFFTNEKVGGSSPWTYAETHKSNHNFLGFSLVVREHKGSKSQGKSAPCRLGNVIKQPEGDFYVTP